MQNLDKNGVWRIANQEELADKIVEIVLENDILFKLMYITDYRDGDGTNGKIIFKYCFKNKRLGKTFEAEERIDLDAKKPRAETAERLNLFLSKLKLKGLVYGETKEFPPFTHEITTLERDVMEAFYEDIERRDRGHSKVYK